jgi:cysteine-S-conjugate beta-lyase
MTKTWKTKLVRPDVNVPSGYQSLVTPVYRGSTTVFTSAEKAADHWDQLSRGYTYGSYGTPTVLELAARVCELEGGAYTLLTACGQASIALVDLSLLENGDHVLVPVSAYKPNRSLTSHLLGRLGIESTYYEPSADIAALIRENTRLVWVESPGSITMEIQDIPAIVEAAHARGVLVVLDNTWSAGVFFDAFAHGVDVMVQALTKYIGGHSDVLLGSVTVRDAKLYERLGSTRSYLGVSVSPDECSLALRGLQTLAVRLATIEKSARDVATWLSMRPEVGRVLHPALPSCPGHELWLRDFTGSSGVFSIVFEPGWSKERAFVFADSLALFDVGYSWGGVRSLISLYEMNRPERGSLIARFSIGLESTTDLLSDLERSFTALG